MIQSKLLMLPSLGFIFETSNKSYKFLEIMDIIRQYNIVEEYRSYLAAIYSIFSKSVEIFSMTTFQIFMKSFLQIKSLFFYVQFSITVVPESTKLIILKGISIISIWKTIKM